MCNSYCFNHDLVSTTYSELQSKKNIPDLIEKTSWLSNSEILHKAPPRLITKATGTSLTGPIKPNNKIREQQPSWYVVIPKCIVLFGVSGDGMLKRYQYKAAVSKHGTITQCCFNGGSASKTVGKHLNSIHWMPRVCAKYTTDPGEPPWPRGSVLGLRLPGFEFQILCLEGSVISHVSLYVHKSGLKPDSWHSLQQTRW